MDTRKKNLKRNLKTRKTGGVFGFINKNKTYKNNFMDWFRYWSSAYPVYKIGWYYPGSTTIWRIKPFEIPEDEKSNYKHIGTKGPTAEDMRWVTEMYEKTHVETEQEKQLKDLINYHNNNCIKEIERIGELLKQEQSKNFDTFIGKQKKL